MKVIRKTNPIVVNLLGKQKIDTKAVYRFLYFCVAVNYQDIVLIYNNMTKAMIQISQAEYNELLTEKYSSSKDFYIENWFLVPINHNDKMLQDQIENVARLFDNKENIYSYTILPTSDCNARCFYCYEKSAAKKSMSETIARDTADFIVRKSANSNIIIQWFGGEPLYNVEAINTITSSLKEKEVKFTSTMITNGYLFDSRLVETAKELWNLKTVTITLDGTEKVYNRVKNYIYKEDISPYKRVINNIRMLMEKEIKVTIRLNFGTYNKEDLYTLVDDLYSYFGNNKFYDIAVCPIWDESPNAPKLTFEKYCEQYNELFKLQDYVATKKIRFANILSSEIFIYPCLAVNPHGIQINPDGGIGKCDHHIYDRLIGNIYSDDFDQNAINSWEGLKPPMDSCETCVCYPTCKEIIQCPSAANRICDEIMQKDYKRILERSIVKTYETLISKQ